MEVTLINNDNAYTQELPVSQISWTHPISRKIGTASISVGRDEPVFSPNYINEDGGSRIVIRHKTFGDWEGVITSVFFTDTGVRLEAAESQIILAGRLVNPKQSFDACSAGLIAREAASQAIAGLSRDILQLGGFADGHLVGSYQFSGQSVLSVFADLLALTGEEWEITQGKLNWIALKGSIYETHLFSGGDLLEWERLGTIDDQLLEVRARTTAGDTYRAFATENVGLPAQEQVEVTVAGIESPLAKLVDAAEQELLGRRFPRITISTEIVPAHWGNIREGDFLHVHFPRMTFGALTALCRITERAFENDGARASFDLALLRIGTAQNPDIGYQSTNDAVTIIRGGGGAGLR